MMLGRATKHLNRRRPEPPVSGRRGEPIYRTSTLQGYLACGIDQERKVHSGSLTYVPTQGPAVH